MFTRLLIAAALALPAMATAKSFSFEKLWTYQHDNAGIGASSEISAWDGKRAALWVVGGTGIQVLTWDGAQVSASAQFTCPNVGLPNSVAIHGDLVVASFNAVAGQVDGWLCLFDAASRAHLATLPAGATPDMVTFTPNGRFVLVANEAERVTIGGQQIDPPGSVAIFRVVPGGLQPHATIGFTATADGTAALRALGVRITPGRLASADLEPEYITVSDDSRTAFVSLQEGNAIAEIDIAAGELTRILPLGTKDYNDAANAIDPSDQDGKTELRPVPVRGLYQPDTIAWYRAKDGRGYVVTANEGDARSDDSDTQRAGARFPGVLPDELRRLNISTIDSTAGDLVTFGGRSLSIRALDGTLVYDSGKRLDAEAIARKIYADNRSDDKGVEPEGLVLAKLGGRTLAFVGLERTTPGAVAVFDISDPADVRFVDLIVGTGDIAPEGLTAFAVGGRHYLAVSHETSHTTTLYEIRFAP